MKKVIIVLVLIMSILQVTGCSSTGDEEKMENIVVQATLDENGNIVIKEDDITEAATFINYEVDGITIGFIAVRGTDGKVRVAFNTCQSCSPSPDAYFIQKGEYLVCQNCGSKFHIDKIGEGNGGCNPAPVKEMMQEEGIITIPVDYAETYQDKFENWNGPKV